MASIYDECKDDVDWVGMEVDWTRQKGHARKT